MLQAVGAGIFSALLKGNITFSQGSVWFLLPVIKNKVIGCEWMAETFDNHAKSLRVIKAEMMVEN